MIATAAWPLIFMFLLPHASPHLIAILSEIAPIVQKVAPPIIKYEQQRIVSRQAQQAKRKK